ncbi:hypothetical protein VI817_000451 [Penicillium citrinum]|nr:hypothetical protein VI817_000451 [Penicillium citrinum]
MEIESRVELPDGHLVNLSPRPHHHGQYQAYRADYATELSANSPSRYVPSDGRRELTPPRGTEDAMFHKTKNIKLPLPKFVAGKGSEQRNQTPSPTAIPKPSSATISGGSAGTPTQSEDRSREHTWRKLRDRFEKDVSPLSQRNSFVRSRNSDQNGSPEKSNTRKPNQAQSAKRGARSAIPSPHNRIPKHNSRNNLTVNASSKCRDADHRSNRPGRSNTNLESSPPSVSPISADESVADWEDRFVVHMPSAKDPNPPTMTTQEISNFQKDLERRKRERRRGRGRVSDISAVSSRDASMERENNSQPTQRSQPGQRTETFKTYKGRPSQSEPASDRQQATTSHSQSPQSQADQNNYYSPEEIGKNRISTIWEESSPSKPKDKRLSQNDGSFLGCKEINGPGVKNPDEILLFSSGQDSEGLHPRPLAIGGKKKPKEGTSTAAPQAQQKREVKDAVLHEERTETSPNTNHAQCSKLSSKSLCQDLNSSDHEMPRSDSQGSSKENTFPRPSFETAKEQLEDRGDDDVFIITPTVTRTMIPSSDKKPLSIKTQGLRRPGGIGQTGTGEAVKAVRAKAQVVSTPSGLRPAGGASQTKSTAPSTASSKKAAPSSIPKPHDSPASKQASQPKDTQTRDTPGRDTPSKGTPSKGPVSNGTPSKGTTDTETPSKDTPSKETPIKDTLSKDSPSKDKSDQDKANNQTSSIRGFIRTSGLSRTGGIVRSPTDSLATILRNGTESLRNRAESFRNANGSLYFSSRKGSPVSLTSAPSRDNSESSRSERSFRSALSSVKDTPPPSTKPSPVKKQSPAPKRVSIEMAPPRVITPPREKRIPRYNTPPTHKTPPKEKASPEEASSGSEEQRLAAEKQARAERLEKFKEEARLRRATKLAAEAELEKPKDKTGEEKEIAELDGHQVTGSSKLHPNITDVCDDLREGLHSERDDSFKEGANSLALSMVFEIIVMAITQMHKAVHQGTDSQYAKVLINNVFNMAQHCYRVFTRVYRVISDYQATGKWPKAKNDKVISNFLIELLQAVLYLFVLGFGALVVGRAASYVLLVGSWMLWFAKPFAWTVQGIGRALVT